MLQRVSPLSWWSLRWHLFILLPISVFCLLPWSAVAALPLDVNPLAGEAVPSVLKRILPSVVSVWYRDEMLTGTILTGDGLVVTCAHLPAKVGDAVEIGLQDGRRVAGKVLSKLPKEGENGRGKDIALLQISAPGTWPAVRIGTTAGLTLRSPILAVGFPDTNLYGSNRAKDPLYVRLGHPIASPYQTDAGQLYTSIDGSSGNSGGPLFDLNGNLIGVCSTGDLSGAHITYTRIEALRSGWRALTGGRPSPLIAAAAPPPPPIRETALSLAPGIRSAVVEVRSQERWIGFGCVVGEGLILTKASELGPDLRVIVYNNYVGLAGIIATDPVHDLALLRLSAPELTQHLTPIQWATLPDLPIGTSVAVATPITFTPLTGITCFRAREVPPIEGTIPCDVKDAGAGVEITEIMGALFEYRLRRPYFPLRVGDIITHIEGRRIPNRETYLKTVRTERTIGTHPRVSGEPVQVTYLRNRKSMTQTVVLEYSATPSFIQLVRPDSLRYSGFPSAIASDLPIRPEHCGAPVVDSQGRVVGLLIARAPFVESLLLPASEVAASLEQMKRSLTTRK